MEQKLQQLNNHTNLFWKQQTKGMDKCVETKAMKHTPENDKKEHF